MTGHAVAPDSVHVWRGFKAAAKPYADFATFLGSVFVPACALLQPRAGLAAYVPSMVPPAGKPPTVPDQTALMFWTDKNQHDAAFRKVAVRAYSNLHGDAYDTKLSKADFPIGFDGAVAPEQPYFLVDQPADWMHGHVHHVVGARPATQGEDDFQAAIAAWAKGYAASKAARIDNALLCMGRDYVALWEHAADADTPFAAGLAALVAPMLDRTAENYTPPAGLWDDWAGIDLIQHDCINIQLRRPPVPEAAR
jgi:hypothetical protein